MASCQVQGAVARLEVMVDPALDCVHLLVTTHTQQYRVLVEQRSATLGSCHMSHVVTTLTVARSQGYVWGCQGGDSCHAPLPARAPDTAADTEVADTGAVQRTRLQSIKQMSVDRIANLRNRLAEGRRLLKTRAEAGEGGARVELVTPDTAAGPLLAVQTDTGSQRYFLSGTR